MEREREREKCTTTIYFHVQMEKKLFGRTSGSNFRGAEEDEISLLYLLKSISDAGQLML